MDTATQNESDPWLKSRQCASPAWRGGCGGARMRGGATGGRADGGRARRTHTVGVRSFFRYRWAQLAMHACVCDGLEVESRVFSRRSEEVEPSDGALTLWFRGRGYILTNLSHKRSGLE